MVFMLFKKEKDLEVVCMFLKNIFFITYTFSYINSLIFFSPLFYLFSISGSPIIDILDSRTKSLLEKNASFSPSFFWSCFFR